MLLETTPTPKTSNQRHLGWTSATLFPVRFGYPELPNLAGQIMTGADELAQGAPGGRYWLNVMLSGVSRDDPPTRTL